MTPTIWIAIACTIAIVGATPALADIDIGIKEITRELCADCGHGGYETLTMIVSVQNMRGDRIFLDESYFYLQYDQYDVECTATAGVVDNRHYDPDKQSDDDVYSQRYFYYVDYHTCTGPSISYVMDYDYEPNSAVVNCGYGSDSKPPACHHADSLYKGKRTESSGHPDCGLDMALPGGETKDVTVCFNIRHAAELITLGLKGAGYVILEDGNECSRNDCIGNIDLARVGDTTFEYHIADTSIYDTVRPGYSDTISQAIRDGLDRWEDSNPHVSFVRVDDRDMADFRISMGGTGESVSFGGATDTYGRVNDIGCLVEADTDCTMKLYVENNNHDGTIDLMNPAMIEYVTVHEVGHLLGLPHHPSALHAMHSTVHTDVDWYDDEYGFTAPALKAPVIRTLEAEGSLEKLHERYQQMYARINNQATDNEYELADIIVGLLKLFGR